MVLVLLGIMGAGAGLGFNQIVKGFMFSKEAAETMGKGQLAMLRMSKEFRVITNVSSGTASSISFTAQHGAGTTTQDYTISVPGGTGELRLDDGANDDILTDRVNSFALSYYDSYDDASPSTTWSTASTVIEVELTLNGPNNAPTIFKTRIVPRNI